MDDDLGLLPEDQPAPSPPRRSFGLLLSALVVVALLAAAGVFWMVTSIADRSGKLTVAGSASPAPATSPAPPPTTPPVARVPTPTVVPTSPAPVRTATTVVPTSRPPAPTPKPTTAPVPAPPPLPPPVPMPTPTTPVGTLVPVPDVVGLRVQLASTVLRQAGFAVQVIGGVQDTGRDDRRITAERPSAGTAVRPGSTVILVTDGT